MFETSVVFGQKCSTSWPYATKDIRNVIILTCMWAILYL